MLLIVDMLLVLYFFGLSCESKRFQGRYCSNDWDVGGCNIPSVLPFLALHLSPVGHHRRRLSRAGIHYYNKEKRCRSKLLPGQHSFQSWCYPDKAEHSF